MTTSSESSEKDLSTKGNENDHDTITTKGEPLSDRYSGVVIKTHQLGVFRLFIAFDKKPFSIQDYVSEFYTTEVPMLSRLCADIYGLAPVLFVLYFVSMFLTALHGAVEMSVASRVLRVIEIAVTERTAAPRDVWWSLGLLASWSAFSASLDHYRLSIFMRLRSRAESHFQLKIMQVDLRKDLPTSQDETTRQRLTYVGAWDALDGMTTFLRDVISALSQILVVTQIAASAGGPLFVLACLVRPIFMHVGNKSVWDRVCFGYDSNEDHVRLRALESLSKERYRADVISGNLADWVIPEYRVIRNKVQDISDEHPLYLYSRHKKLVLEILGKVFENLPLMYCVMTVLVNPARISLSGVAIMRSSATELQYSLISLIKTDNGMKKKIADLKALYSSDEVKNVMEDGKSDYPHEKSNPQGMSFELKDISFSYPSSEKKEQSLKSVNLSIPSGSVVVIVGSNGSGKSTLIRLLSRLYDPTSGSLFIDGRPSTSYRMSSLRESSVLLCQDHNVFPLSFAENIGLGYPPLLSDMNLVRESAEKGGAKGFIDKLEKGFGTVLDPRIAVVSNKLEHHPEHPLQAEKKKIKTKSDISGGERQRVVASRAFMRMHSSKIRFVAVDEPTSALDSEGELQLFTKLLEAREGKTMIFVTHRFGYLTKHADMIVCMKDGVIEEVGRHSELILKKDGEYAKLYNIQASAFLADAVGTPSL